MKKKIGIFSYFGLFMGVLWLSPVVSVHKDLPTKEASNFFLDSVEVPQEMGNERAPAAATQPRDILSCPPARIQKKMALGNKHQIRAVWLSLSDGGPMDTIEKLQQAFLEIKALKFNTVYINVWSRGVPLFTKGETRHLFDDSPYYSSKLFTNAQGGERDVLQEAITLGHGMELKVYAWFEYGFRVHAHNKAGDLSKLMKDKGYWFTEGYTERPKVTDPVCLRTTFGNPVMKKSRIKKVASNGRASFYWGHLNPLHPEAQTTMTHLVLDVVKNYDVDGVQFDDHFSQSIEFGYDGYTTHLFEKETGNEAPLDFSDPEWVRWRANKFTEYMRKLSAAIRAANKNVVISLSPNNYSFSLNGHIMDWATWVEEGLVDELIVQIYMVDAEEFIAQMREPNIRAAQRCVPTGLAVFSGVSKNRQKSFIALNERLDKNPNAEGCKRFSVPILVDEQIDLTLGRDPRTRDLAFDGVGLFEYGTLKYNFPKKTFTDEVTPFFD